MTKITLYPDTFIGPAIITSIQSRSSRTRTQQNALSSLRRLFSFDPDERSPCLSASVPIPRRNPRRTGYRSEVMAEVMIQESEFVRLAEAIPADKYTWRPSPDVRNIAEVFLHASATD
jgi:hypothetical protein